MMPYKYFSRNHEILPIEQASIPLDNIAYQYGFGVYESIRVTNGEIRFIEDHCQRLIESAKIINLLHDFSIENISQGIRELVTKNEAQNCNVKILLIGGSTRSDTTLNILCINRLYPDRKLYKVGVKTITYQAERNFPHAKSLNMLTSYLAYQKAQQAEAYDALLINREGNITEGTRTNFFAMQGRTLISPPEAQILLGVTRHYIIKVAQENDFKVEHRIISPKDLSQYDAAFISNTSTKILPVRVIDNNTFNLPYSPLQELMQAFRQFLDSL